MSFFSNLYSYKQSLQRGAFEDFLTELLAEWLRLADVSGYSERVLVRIFKLSPDQLPSGPITWSTQHVIPRGYGKASRRKPDLAGSAPGFLFLIENKVSAGFTSHVDDLAGEETPQLDLYQSYLDLRAENGIKETGGLCLLTFATPAPKGWAGRVSYWSEFGRALRSDLHQRCIDPNSAFGYLTRELIAFLQEQGMGSIELHEGDMVAMPAVRRLEKAFGQLAGLAVREAAGVLSLNRLEVPLEPCGNTIGDRGDFRAPWFYGEVLTKDGAPFNSSAFVAWAGVMTADVDWISPLNDDIPEVTVGLAIWCDRASFDGPDDLHLEAFEFEVKKLCPGEWSWQRLGRTENGPVMIFSIRMPFNEVWSEAQLISWDEWSSQFFRSHLTALLTALNSPFQSRTFGAVLEEWIHRS